ncbi:MAG TPA: hypothetical protein VGJ42_05280 [Nitrososphaera sp.]
MASPRRYLYVAAAILAVSGAFAIYLNFQGFRCLSDLARVDSSVIEPRHLEEMERNCSIITNSYVYSVYGIIAGIVLLVIGLMRKRKGNVS